MTSEDLENITLPPGDDFGIPSDDEDLREEFVLDQSFASTIGA